MAPGNGRARSWSARDEAWNRPWKRRWPPASRRTRRRPRTLREEAARAVRGARSP